VPAHDGEQALLLNVAPLVALNLVPPIVSVSLGQTECGAALVPVPEAAVDENHRAVLPQHQVGMPRQAWMVEPVAEAAAEQEAAHNQLGLGVLAVYRRHAAVALFFCKLVGHVRAIVKSRCFGAKLLYLLRNQSQYPR